VMLTLAKAAELITRLARRLKSLTRNRCLSPPATQRPRSAGHWFLDAAVYARDGDNREARAAALRGVAALEASR
jgi:hypothetical protein